MVNSSAFVYYPEKGWAGKLKMQSSTYIMIFPLFSMKHRRSCLFQNIRGTAVYQNSRVWTHSSNQRPHTIMYSNCTWFLQCKIIVKIINQPINLTLNNNRFVLRYSMNRGKKANLQKAFWKRRRGEDNLNKAYFET